MSRILLLLYFLGAMCFGADKAPQLSFFIVHKERFESSRFLDTPQYPKLGYVSRRPDFQIAALKFATANPGQPWTDRDKSGKVISSGYFFEVSIGVLDQDQKSLEAFTREYTGKNMVILIGEQIVSSAVIKQPFITGGLSIFCPNEDHMLSVTKQFKSLVKP